MSCTAAPLSLRSKELKSYIERVGSYRLAEYSFRSWGSAVQDDLDKTYALVMRAYDQLSELDRSQPGGAAEPRIIL